MSERLSPEARAFLDQVRAAEEPTRDDEERVRRALDASIAAGVTCHWERYPLRGDAVAAPPGDAGAAVTKAGALARAGAAAAKASAVAWAAPFGVLALCATAWLVTGEPVAPTAAPAGSSASAPSSSSSPGMAPSLAPGERGIPEQGASEQGTRRDPTSQSQDEQKPASRPEAPSVDAGVPSATRAPSTSRVRPKPPRTTRTTNAAPAERSAPNGLAAELAQLQRAQSALRRGDGAGALRELDAAPDGGQLLDERRVARVLALCSLGRAAEARALAAEVMRDDPHSVQRAALERSCANPSRNRER